MDLIEKVKGFLLEPSRTFQYFREDSLAYALKYYFILYLVYVALDILVRIFFGDLINSLMGEYAMISVNAGTEEIIIGSIYDAVYVIPAIFIGGAFLEVGVYIVGGRMGLNQTIKAILYSSTPTLLFGWVPVLNIIAGIWSIVLNIVGIREFHGISSERAILAMTIPIILLLLITAIFAGAIFLPGIRIPWS